MQTILRRKFADTPLDAAFLDAVAGLWLHWLERSPAIHIVPGQRFHRVEAQLWGIARPELETARQRVARRAVQEVPDALATLSDGDILSVVNPWRDFLQPVALARMAALFAGEEFEGMHLALRLSAGYWREVPGGLPLREGTLVLWTELRTGVPHLKAAWPSNLSGRGETTFHFAAWAGETQFWEAVDAFRKNGEAPCRQLLFISPARQMVRRALRWLKVDVGEQRTLRAFLIRLATFGGLAALCFGWILLTFSLPAEIVGFPLGALSLRWFVITLVKKARNVANFRRNMKARLREVYSRPATFVEVNLSEATAWPEATTAKMSREAEFLGCVHCRDVRRAEPSDIASYVRIYALPAQRAYVFLTLMHGTRSHVHFPAKAWFIVTTYFTDDTRLMVANEYGGYNQTRDPRAIQRFFPEAENLADLLEMRRPVAERLLSEGKVVAPLMAVGALLVRMEEDHVRIGEAARRAGYFGLSGAIRQSFHLPRREYRRRT